MMRVERIALPSDFATNKQRLVKILTIQNIKGLLFLSDICVQQLRESTQQTHHVDIIIFKRLVENWSLEIVPPESTSALGKLFGFISPSIVKLVLKFKLIVQVQADCQVNSNVHLLTYNSFIAEEACKKLVQ